MDFGFGFKASSWMAYSMKGRCIKAAWSVCVWSVYNFIKCKNGTSLFELISDLSSSNLSKELNSSLGK